MEQHHFQWPSTTPNPYFQGHAINWHELSETVSDMKLQWNNNTGLLMCVISNDLERLCAMFGVTEYFAVSRWEMSFVSYNKKLSCRREAARCFVFVFSQLQHTYSAVFLLPVTATSDLLVYKILLWLGYPMVKKFRRYLYSFWRNSRKWRTQRHTHIAWRHRPRLCIASRGKNGYAGTCASLSVSLITTS